MTRPHALPLLLLLLLARVAALPLQAAERPNLTGTWVPDAARSLSQKQLEGETAKPAPPPAPAAAALPRVQIDHRDPALTIRYLEPSGETISSYAFTTDGVEATNDRGGGLVHRSTSLWRGAALVTTWRLESGGSVLISGSDSRELGDEGRTLTVIGDVEDARSRSHTVTVYALASGGAGAADPGLSPGAAARELARLFDEDQSDSRPYGTAEERAATDARARQRIEQVSAIVAQGLLRSADDYYHAAMVYQHGNTPQDALSAHLMANIAAFEGHPWGRWLSAASLDLFLLSIERQQVLGTIYGERNFTRYDRALPDEVRREFCVPPLAVQERNEAALVQGRREGFQRRASECEQ